MLRCTIQDVSDVVTGKLGARRRASKKVKRPVDEDELGNWFGREPSLGVEWDPVRPFLPLSICGEGHLERAVSSRKRQSKQAQEVISDERERERKRWSIRSTDSHEESPMIWRQKQFQAGRITNCTVLGCLQSPTARSIDSCRLKTPVQTQCSTVVVHEIDNLIDFTNDVHTVSWFHATYLYSIAFNLTGV